MADLGATAIIALIGATVSAGAAVAQGVASSKAATFNAKVADRNATAATQAAAENARRFKRTSAKRLGDIRASRNMEGSALDLLEDSAMQEKLQELSIIHAGATQAQGFGDTANLERARGSAALKSGFAEAGSALLIGGAQAASSMPKGGGDTKTTGKKTNYGGTSLVVADPNE
jgi:hypothetical protein